MQYGTVRGRVNTAARLLATDVESDVNQAFIVVSVLEDVSLHHLLLHGLLLTLHGAAVGVASVVEAERTTAVSVALELLDRGSSVLLTAEENDTGSTRAAVRLVLDLSLLDVADGDEELDQILVAGTPWQLWRRVSKVVRGEVGRYSRS